MLSSFTKVLTIPFSAVPSLLGTEGREEVRRPPAELEMEPPSARKRHLEVHCQPGSHCGDLRPDAADQKSPTSIR